MAIVTLHPPSRSRSSGMDRQRRHTSGSRHWSQILNDRWRRGGCALDPIALKTERRETDPRTVAGVYRDRTKQPNIRTKGRSLRANAQPDDPGGRFSESGVL